MGLIDLDELALRCRGEQSKQYIREAVLCYKAGAYRSTIVATWNAIVFDFIHKMRELELSGDKNAEKILKDLEGIRAGGEAKLKDALEFEREVLNFAASDFELLTPLEKKDLLRLQEDRNRCAHPSMQSDDTMYNPTAELARTHLRAAVEIMLSREPVQGVAAQNRIFSEIKSEYFPISVEDAVEHFKRGPLNRARRNLVRNLLVGLTKSILKDKSLDFGEKKKLRIALCAVIEIHRQTALDIMKSELPTIVKSTDDESILMLTAYCSHIPEAWDVITEPYQKKIARYIAAQSGKELLYAISAATKNEHLKGIVLDKLKDLTPEHFANLVSFHQLPEYIPTAIDLLKSAASFRSAENVFDKCVIPLSSLLSSHDVEAILDAVTGNEQAWYASGMPKLLTLFFDKTYHLCAELKYRWIRFIVDIDDAYPQEDKSEWYSELKVKVSML